ncbi:hypothetical protein [Rubritalea marina]|uniref:hypothetical protein n=1 Tax=Rubritalea marina TaxID=361055 RepID=UPI00047633A3|nr:hypothetical protein [Rubritalea marina]
MSRRARRKTPQSRKKSSSVNIPMIMGGAALALAIISFFFKSDQSPEEAAARDFPLAIYVEDCNSLRGNQYQISGEITENAQQDPSVGKFIFLRVDNVPRDTPSDTPQQVGILVPSDLTGPNIETRQNYSFIVEVRKEGYLVASKYSAR